MGISREREGTSFTRTRNRNQIFAKT